MRLSIVALGQRMPAWIDAGFDEYAKRMPREYGLELIEIKPEPRDRGKSVEQMLSAETVRIRAACADDRIVAVSEGIPARCGHQAVCEEDCGTGRQRGSGGACFG